LRPFFRSKFMVDLGFLFRIHHDRRLLGSHLMDRSKHD
jgi:hypothetical protein